MKMARAASAVQFIASKNVGANDANLFDKTEIQDLYEWLKSISLQEYLPVLLQMGVEEILHLVDLEAEDVQEAGMTRPERKRFLRKQAEITLDYGLGSLNRPVTLEKAASEHGERAIRSVAEPDSMDRLLSGNCSARSQISVISASSSCMPSTEREDSSTAHFFMESPASQMHPRHAMTIDLGILEQRAQAICRIQRNSDDLDLGFGFIFTLDGQQCIITCLEVIGAREDAAKAAAVFADREGLMKCRLDADKFWCKSEEIGYCAVGAIFDKPEYTTRVADVMISTNSCKCDENVVMCHWGEVDRQFTIHKVSSLSLLTVQFPVRAGLLALPGTPVFSGNFLMGLSMKKHANDGKVITVRASAIFHDLKTQTASAAQSSKPDSKTSKRETASDGKLRKTTEISLHIPAVASLFSSGRSSGEEQEQAVGPSMIDFTPQQKSALLKLPSPSPTVDNGNSRQNTGGQSRRPPRPVNNLPCLNLPSMSGGSGPPARSDKNFTPLDSLTTCVNALPVQTFDIAHSSRLVPMPVGVALDFQEHASESAETLQPGSHDTAVTVAEGGQPKVEEGDDPSLGKELLDTYEQTLSQNNTHDKTHESATQASESIQNSEPLSARSHHDPQTDALAVNTDKDTNAESSLEHTETRGILSALTTASVSSATQILTRHSSCQLVAHAVFQRLDELCNDSVSNRQGASEAGTVEQVLRCLNTHEASADSHASALSLLSSLSFSKELQYNIVDKDGINTILRLMKAQQASVKIQFRACRALCNLGYESEEIQLQMVGQGGIPVVLSAMEKHLSSSKVQAEGCGVLCNLAANNESNFKSILAHGGISAIVQAMSMHGSQLSVLYKGCCALCSLTMTTDSHSQAVEEGAASTVIKSMLMHPDHHDLLYKGCGVLANLSQTPKFASMIAKQGGVAAIVKGLTGPASDCRLQGKGLRALCAMCKASETLTQMVRQGAIEATIQIMTKHEKEVELQERACVILSHVVRNRAINDKTALQQQSVHAILRAIMIHTNNESVIIEGSNALAVLALQEGAKEKILQASVLPHAQEMLEKCRMSANAYAAVKRLERALHPLDSFLDGEAPDTRDTIRRSKSKVKGEQRPISAILQSLRPPRTVSAAAVRLSRRPASATFASGSGAMLVKDLRRALGKDEVDGNLLIQHQIEALRSEAETLRHENLKMMAGAADSIAALRDVHGVEIVTTVKRRPVSALNTIKPSPYASVSTAGLLRPPSGKCIRVSKDGKRAIGERQTNIQLAPLGGRGDFTKSEPREPSVRGMQLEVAALVKHSPEPEQAKVPMDASVLDSIHGLIATGRTNEQVARHFSLLDFGITADDVEACRRCGLDCTTSS